MSLVQACLLFLIQWTGLTMAAEQSSQGITLSAGAAEFVVGGSIPVKLVYKNNTPAHVTFKEPLKTWETQFRVIRGDALPEDRPFGKMSSYTISTGIERRTIEAAKPITLDPRQEITFDYDIGARWPELFSPGVVRVRVVDLNGEMWLTGSNELTWRIVFTQESVSHLLAMLDHAQSTPDSKQFAVRWLRTLNADFSFNLEDDSATAAQANKTALKNFRKWWATHRDSDNVAKQLAANNSTK